jgi:hypothetical protein
VKLLAFPSFLLLTVLLHGCDTASRFSSNNPASSPAVEQSPVPIAEPEKPAYTYDPIADSKALSKAIHLFDDAGKKMARSQIAQCRKDANQKQLAKYKVVFVLFVSNQVVCAGSRSEKGFYYNADDTWEFQQEIPSQSSLARINFALEPRKMALIMESRSKNVRVLVKDAPEMKELRVIEN